MSKTQCKYSVEEYEAKKPENPKYKCKKCWRVSKKDDGVCKGEKVKG